MKYFLYNIGIRVFHGLFLIASLFHRKAKEIIKGRKKSKAELEHIQIDTSVLWFHCASLGEWEQAIPIVDNLKQQGDFSIILSFYSSSGFVHAKRLDLVDWVFYLEVDFRHYHEEIFNKFKVSGLFFIKYDLWPNLIQVAISREIPLFLLCADVVEGSMFVKNNSFVHQLLHQFSWISCNNPLSQTLLIKSGLSEVYADGSTKLERAYNVSQEVFDIHLLDQWKGGNFVVIGGSVWPKEIEWLKKMRNGNLDVPFKMIIVPHEPKEEIIKKLQAEFGPESILFSEMDIKYIDKTCIIMDRVGYLSRLYRYGDIALVGGGFGKSIHNIAEPAAYGLPVVSGPNNKGFSEAEVFQEIGIYYVANDYENWIKIFKKANKSNIFRDEIRYKANQFFIQQKNAAKKVADRIMKSVK